MSPERANMQQCPESLDGRVGIAITTLTAHAGTGFAACDDDIFVTTAYKNEPSRGVGRGIGVVGGSTSRTRQAHRLPQEASVGDRYSGPVSLRSLWRTRIASS